MTRYLVQKVDLETEQVIKQVEADSLDDAFEKRNAWIRAGSGYFVRIRVNDTQEEADE